MLGVAAPPQALAGGCQGDAREGTVTQYLLLRAWPASERQVVVSAAAELPSIRQK